MTPVAPPAKPRTDDAKRAVRRSIAVLVLTACAAFGIVATGSVLIAHRVAREQSLGEAVRTGIAIGNDVFAQDVSALMHGDARAMSELDMSATEAKSADSVVRIKVWSANGTVLYSDDHTQIGQTFALTANLRGSIAEHRGIAGVSDLGGADNAAEAIGFARLVEVHLPLMLTDGSTVALELYSTDQQLRSSEGQLVAAFVPLALGGLVLLLVLQLPAAVWLVRRAGRAQAERARLLTAALTVSTRDRRTIAGDLHDGVIQDLAGVGYALGAATRSIDTSRPPAEIERMLSTSGDAVQRAVRDLRSLVVEIRPPDLTAEGLAQTLEELAERVQSAHQVTVRVRVDLPGDLAPVLIATMYRCARECLTNVLKHAAAGCVLIEAGADRSRVWLTVSDDGRGLPPEGIGRSSAGHVGLTLLGEAAHDLGGVLTVAAGDLGGTEVSLELPRRQGNDL